MRQGQAPTAGGEDAELRQSIRSAPGFGERQLGELRRVGQGRAVAEYCDRMRDRDRAGG